MALVNAAFRKGATSVGPLSRSEIGSRFSACGELPFAGVFGSQWSRAFHNAGLPETEIYFAASISR